MSGNGSYDDFITGVYDRFLRYFLARVLSEIPQMIGGYTLFRKHLGSICNLCGHTTYI